MRKHLTINGRRLSYLEQDPPGAHRTLVLLHAFPLNAEMWAPQLALALPAWRVVAPDLRGFGAADPDDAGDLASGRLTLEDYGRDVQRLLNRLGVQTPVIAGLSLGGYVAFAMMRAGTDPIGGLILADTRPQADSEEARAGRLRMIGLVDREGAAGVAAEMLPKLLSDEAGQKRPEVVAQAKRLLLASRPNAIKAALYRMMARPDSTALLEQVRCPTLIVVGEHDVLTPPELSREMQRRIAGASLAIIPSAGHLSNLEAPDAFKAALIRFLNAV